MEVKKKKSKMVGEPKENSTSEAKGEGGEALNTLPDRKFT